NLYEGLVHTNYPNMFSGKGPKLKSKKVRRQLGGAIKASEGIEKQSFYQKGISLIIEIEETCCIYEFVCDMDYYFSAIKIDEHEVAKLMNWFSLLAKGTRASIHFLVILFPQLYMVLINVNLCMCVNMCFDIVNIIGDMLKLGSGGTEPFGALIYLIILSHNTIHEILFYLVCYYKFVMLGIALLLL
ncbi:hypothetical protein ACJX0J_031490, partial [Zea mays]